MMKANRVFLGLVIVSFALLQACGGEEEDTSFGSSDDSGSSEDSGGGGGGSGGSGSSGGDQDNSGSSGNSDTTRDVSIEVLAQFDRSTIRMGEADVRLSSVNVDAPELDIGCETRQPDEENLGLSGAFICEDVFPLRVGRAYALHVTATVDPDELPLSGGDFEVSADIDFVNSGSSELDEPRNEIDGVGSGETIRILTFTVEDSS